MFKRPQRAGTRTGAYMVFRPAPATAFKFAKYYGFPKLSKCIQVVIFSKLNLQTHTPLSTQLAHDAGEQSELSPSLVTVGLVYNLLYEITLGYTY
jgi:hypothetical protein